MLRQIRSSRGLAQTFRAISVKNYSVVANEQNLISKSLKEVDPEMNEILRLERQRQKSSITLIPSENFTSKSVMELLGSEMQNKYSEGYPGARYYGGNQFIDMAESLCQKRALEAFGLNPEEWGVNVQNCTVSV